MAKYLDLNGLAYLWAKLKEKLLTKVDKVEGKGLSTNDYTAAEKTKLGSIAANANNYAHPAHPAKVAGLYKVTVDASGHVSAATGVTKADITALGIPGADTNTTYNNMVGATVAVDGAAGLVPLPIKGTATRFLRSDGTWEVPEGTTYTLGSFGVTATAAELNYTDGVTSPIQAQLNGKAATTHTHAVATAAVDGLLAKTDKAKLDAVAAGAQVNVVEGVRVNGVALSPAAKVVNIDLTNYATKADMASVYKVKGSKATVAELPATGNISGDVWNITTTGSNHVWTGTEWDKLSETVDLSVYLPRTEVVSITNAEIDTVLAS